jgi:hypothetical protein
VGLVARHLEANGLPTVILGSARDIAEQCGVPRFLFSDFPLGNPCGKPWERDMQRTVVGYALDLLESATLPRTTVQTPFVWSEDQSWRERYGRIDPAKAEKLRQMGESRRAAQQRAKQEGRARTD